MSLNLNFNLTNNLDGYLADAKNIKGTYVVVEYPEDLENLPEATIVAGSLAYVTYNSSFYIYNGGWSKIILESIPDDIININSNLDITTTTTLTINIDNLGAWIDGNKVESHVIIAFTDYGIIFSPNGGGSLLNPSIGFDLTTIIFYNSKQYLAVLHINPSSNSNNATLSFQELQASSGGGGSGTQDVSLIDSTISYTLTSSDVDLANATSTLIDFTQAGEATVLPIFQKARELLSANKLGLIRLTMQIADLKLL